MRVFGRFLYSLAAVGFFLLAFTYSRDLMMSKYLENVFEPSLTDETFEHPKFYYFYSSIPDFHNSEPVITINDSGYEIMGYEVAQTKINNNNELEVTESIYLIVYSDTEDLSAVDYINLENSTAETTHKIYLQRFKTLNLINGVNDQGNVYLSKETFFSEDFDTLCVVDKNGNNLIEVDFSISEDDFIIKSYMESFYAENERIPGTDDLNVLYSHNIFLNQTHIANDYIHIFYIAMGIYFTLLIVTTYFVFFKKKKRIKL